MQALYPAIIGLAGVVIGVIAGLASTWISVRHDAKQRKLDREMNLRREVYLDAASGLAQAQLLLTRIGQPEFDPNQLAGQASSSIGWYNKVQLVASVGTFEAFAKGEALFQSALVRMIPLRYKLDQVHLDLQSIQGRKYQLNQYQQELLSGVQDVTDAEMRDRYNRLVGTQTQIEELVEKEANLLSEKAERQRAILFEVAKSTAEFRRRMAEAVVALRQELDLPLEADRYRAAVEDVLNQTEVAWQKLLGDLSENSTERPEGSAES